MMMMKVTMATMEMETMIRSSLDRVYIAGSVTGVIRSQPKWAKSSDNKILT